MPDTRNSAMNEAELDHLTGRATKVGLPDILSVAVTRPMANRLRAKALVTKYSQSELMRAAMIAGWRQMFDEDLNAIL